MNFFDELQCLMEEHKADFWAEQEFFGAKVGDARRTARLIMIAAAKAKNPEAAMSLCMNKNDSQSICRFFARPEVTLDSVLECHIKRTVERCNEQEKIYITHDSSFLSYTGHKALQGLGRLCHENTGKGLVMHTGLALTANGTPLGVMHVRVWSRPDDPRKKTKQEKLERIKALKNTPIEEKESYKWIDCSKNAFQLLENSPCKVILVSDRESDIFEYFAQKRPENFDFLARLKFNRCAVDPDEAGENQKLFDLMEKSAPIGRYKLNVPPHDNEKAYKAKMILKSGSITIEPHEHLKRQGYSENLTLNWVYSKEVNADKKPEDLLEWKLLTTLPVNTFDEVMDCIRGYAKRWVIEEYHRVLKSGCGIERLQFATLDRMYPAMAVCFVVAWRVLFLLKYARENPDEDAKCVCTKLEKLALSLWLKKNRFKHWRIKTVEDFVRGVGILGGNPDRRTGGRPGPKNIWLGLKYLNFLVQGLLLVLEIPQVLRLRDVM